MTSNDAQMDVLLRRYAGQAPDKSSTDHLDPDELAAFAEGAVPDAARSRYVSHLADCGNCRQIVSHLSVSSGAVLAAEVTPAVAGSGYSWWKRLGGFFSPMTLRYAAFALVLISVAGVVFLVTRRPQESSLIAQSNTTNPVPESAVRPPGEVTSGNPLQSEGNNNAPASKPSPSPQNSPFADQPAKPDQPRPETVAAAPPQPAKESDVISNPGIVASKRAEPAPTEPAPSYAPPPPPVVSQRQDSVTREQQSQLSSAQAAGGRKSGPADQFKTVDKTVRSSDVSKDGVDNEDRVRLAANRAPASKRGGEEKLKGPRRDMDSNAALNRNADERSRNVAGNATQSITTEDKPVETRSAGGRKFRRQGNSWVDLKYKPSMPVKSIARGSSEFNELDSGLRSLVQQLGGQVLVVWKGKAYSIR